MFARGYFIPGCTSQRGVVGRLRFRVACCQTPSEVFDGLGWVTLGPVGARQGPVWSHMCPYISRTSYGTVERSVRACRGLSGHIGFRWVSVGTLIWHDRTRRGSTDRSTVPYWCTIDVRTHTGPYGVPTGPPGPHRDPTDPRRTAGGTVGPRLIGASPVWAARSSYWRSQGYL